MYLVTMGVRNGVHFPDVHAVCPELGAVQGDGHGDRGDPILQVDRGNARPLHTGRGDGESVRVQPGGCAAVFGQERVLPPERINAIKDNPQALVDPSALETLKERFAAAGPDGAQIADQFLAALKSALAGAIGDVFTVSLVVIVIALVVALFLRSSGRAVTRSRPDAPVATAPAD